jgi:hypothetical protein
MNWPSISKRLKLRFARIWRHLKATVCCCVVMVVRSPCPRNWWPTSASRFQNKQAIARAAVTRIREHARIIIDSGSTTAAMIPELGQQPGLVVMTNSLHVANALNELEHEPVLLMTGGTWDPHSESFQGRSPSRYYARTTSISYLSVPMASIWFAEPPPSTNCWG